MNINKRIQEESLKAFPIISNVKGGDCNLRNRQDWVDACNKGVEIMREFMETLKDFDVWKDWKYIDQTEEVEWDDSHELNNVLNKMVDDVFPELTKENWKQIDWETEEYVGILHRTQNMIPIDSGNSLHCHHSDYDIDGTMYRLTWTIGGGISESPIMERKFN